MAQSALACILAHGEDIVPVSGTGSADRVAENVAAAGLKLSPDDLSGIARILPHSGFGARFPEGQMPVWE